MLKVTSEYDLVIVVVANLTLLNWVCLHLAISFGVAEALTRSLKLRDNRRVHVLPVHSSDPLIRRWSISEVVGVFKISWFL